MLQLVKNSLIVPVNFSLSRDVNTTRA